MPRPEQRRRIRGCFRR